MTQNAELDRIKKVILNLSNRTVENGCSEAESFQAMQRMGEYLEQYNLSMSDIEITQQKCTTMVIDTGIKKRSPIMMCSVRLAELFSCRVWVSNIEKGSGKNAHINFFGTETDLQMVKYLHHTINSAMNKAADDYMDCNFPDRTVRGLKRSHRSNFKAQFIDQISLRLKKMKQELDAQMLAKQSTGTSLMVLKTELVEREWEIQHNWKTRKHYSGYKPKVVTGARAAGARAANTVNLSAPIESAGANQLYLE